MTVPALSLPLRHSPNLRLPSQARRATVRNSLRPTGPCPIAPPRPRVFAGRILAPCGSPTTHTETSPHGSATNVATKLSCSQRPLVSSTPCHTYSQLPWFVQRNLCAAAKIATFSWRSPGHDMSAAQLRTVRSPPSQASGAYKEYA